jgi:DNA processing protein
VRLAAGRVARPDRVRRAVAARLDVGVQPDAATIVADLEAAAGADGARPGDVATPRAAATLARRLLATGARVHVVGYPGYPSRLAQAWPELGAPLWLFTLPGRALPDGPAVAVVGTRHPSLDGLHTAAQLGRLLAGQGVTVVSGMARGIDQAAHRGALDAGGSTVAVLGTGFGVDYPSGDGSLRAAVAASGGLATELVPGTRPNRWHFPWRNRIVSGLADATVVVEGGARSGALQTARLAAAQGREVFAVPGSVHAPASRGPLDLVRDGARALTRLEDVLEVLDHPGPGVRPADDAHASLTDDTDLDPVAAAVARLLGPTPASPSALAAACDQPVGAVLAAVADLVARGRAAATPNGPVALFPPR